MTAARNTMQKGSPNSTSRASKSPLPSVAWLKNTVPMMPRATRGRCGRTDWATRFARARVGWQV
eukprot:5417978-Alexandrium_andersonii.AAC.1